MEAMRRCTFYVPNVPSDSFLTTSSYSYRDSFHHPRDLYALRWGLDNGEQTNRCMWHTLPTLRPNTACT
jgi:hypothetical protein